MARPDLAMKAMRRILSRVETELAEEAEHVEHQRIRREDRLYQIRARHGARHAAQAAIGVKPPTHNYGSVVEKRRLQGSASTPALVPHDVDSQHMNAAAMDKAAHLNRPVPGMSVAVPEGASDADLAGLASSRAQSASSAGLCLPHRCRCGM